MVCTAAVLTQIGVGVYMYIGTLPVFIISQCECVFSTVCKGCCVSMLISVSRDGISFHKIEDLYINAILLGLLLAMWLYQRRTVMPVRCSRATTFSLIGPDP